jgi:hypothetical protein
MGVYIYLLAGISAPGSGQLAKQVGPKHSEEMPTIS